VNVVGETVTVLTSTDPTKAGVTGRVLLETLNMLVLDSAGRTVRVEKAGAAFMLVDSGELFTGSDVAGRLQDRWGRRAV